MSESMLLYMGVFVFSMMAVGLGFTMLEFSALRRRENRDPRAVERPVVSTESHRWHGNDASAKTPQPEAVPHGT